MLIYTPKIIDFLTKREIKISFKKILCEYKRF